MALVCADQSNPVAEEGNPETVEDQAQPSNPEVAPSIAELELQTLEPSQEPQQLSNEPQDLSATSNAPQDLSTTRNEPQDLSTTSNEPQPSERPNEPPQLSFTSNEPPQLTFPSTEPDPSETSIEPQLLQKSHEPQLADMSNEPQLSSTTSKEPQPSQTTSNVFQLREATSNEPQQVSETSEERQQPSDTSEQRQQPSEPPEKRQKPSETSEKRQPSAPSTEPPSNLQDDEEKDLEDGEIEDDDAEDETPTPAPTAPSIEPKDTTIDIPVVKEKETKEQKERTRRERSAERRSSSGRHDDGKKVKHMTEAEKSILHLRRRERMQRERWEKMRKEQQVAVPVVGEPPIVDDFAINLEKAIASVLKKDKSGNSEDDEMRNRKRKVSREGGGGKLDRPSRAGKQRKLDSPGCDPDDHTASVSPRSPDDRRSSGASDKDSYDSDGSAERKSRDHATSRRTKSQRTRDKKQRKKSRERRTEQQLKDAQGVCVFFLQGKCQKNDCPYSHEAIPPMKLELCKFYLMECCAKGDKCSYMHSEFPCKFYHTGLPCLQGDQCKFAHGKPLTEGLRQILFKHIETAPREILGGFPRMSRDEALNMINMTQQSLHVKYGSSGGDKKDVMSPFDVPMPQELMMGGEDNKQSKSNEKPRNRPSRWQDPEPAAMVAPSTNIPPPNVINMAVPPPMIASVFAYGVGHDQDMRMMSGVTGGAPTPNTAVSANNGDIDMRTLMAPLQMAPPPTVISSATAVSVSTISDVAPSVDDSLMNFTQDVDIRNASMLQFDTDFRTNQGNLMQPQNQSLNTSNLSLNASSLSLNTSNMGQNKSEMVPDLPKTQRDLYMRIQAHQQTKVPEAEDEDTEMAEAANIDNINWYSDDDDEDDDNRLTIKDEDEDNNKRDEPVQQEPIKPADVVDKLGDLSKIDISAEVTKLLTTITQNTTTKVPRVDPRQQNKTASTVAPSIIAPSIPAAISMLLPPQIASPPQTVAPSTRISIYDQSNITSQLSTVSTEAPASPDSSESSGIIESIRSARPDIDLRHLALPFKGMQNYTPAKEIDASVNSHPPIFWKVYIVDIPRPDYTGLKLNVQEAEKTGDPRLKKIFKLNTASSEDSPASPKAVRIDPRLKKSVETSNPLLQQQPQPDLTYNQQLNILQSSAFFQSLTSKQKVLLTQELANRNEQNGSHDPILNSLLSNLNLIPGAGLNATPTMGVALGILANVNKLNPPVAMLPMGGGLLGAAPGIPNMGAPPPDFQVPFGDPRSAAQGLLGNGPPPPPFVNYQQPPQEGVPQGPPFNNDFFGPPPPQQDFNRDRFNNRDRRRGGGGGNRQNFNRNNNNPRNFRNNRNNRNNRGHTPP